MSELITVILVFLATVALLYCINKIFNKIFKR